MRIGHLVDTPSIPVEPFPSPDAMLPHLGSLGLGPLDVTCPSGQVADDLGNCITPTFSTTVTGSSGGSGSNPSSGMLACGWLLSNGVSIQGLGITDGMSSWFKDPSATLSGLFDGNVWQCTMAGGSQWVIGAALMPVLALGALGMVFGRRRFF